MLRANRHNGQGLPPAVEVRAITLVDLRRLRLPDRFLIDPAELESAIASYPARSFWIPATGECAIIIPWRHRPELPSLAHLSAFEHETEVLGAAIASARDADAKALVFLDALEYRRAPFYERHGFELLEHILTLELAQAVPSPPNGLNIRFVQLSARDIGPIEATAALDQRAFPWLWWNTVEEFLSYLGSPGVEVWAGTIDREIVSYIGITHFPGWGHLDRIAVSPDHQRRGLGRLTLDFAIRRLRQGGARRIALSTQGDNARSLRLYASAGFHRTPEHDYSVYGVVFDHALLPVKDRRDRPDH